MKDLKHTRALVEKYLEGQTSLKEEQELRNFFMQENVPEDILWLRDQFGYFRSMESQKPRNVEDMLQKVVSGQDSRRPVNRRTIRMIWMRGIGMAASLIILLGTVLLFWNRQQNDYGDALAEPAMVYKEAQKTLREVSREMNQVKGQLKNLSKINQGAGYIQNIQVMEESMKDLVLFSEFSKTKEKISK